jgi:hypothetical protein
MEFSVTTYLADIPLKKIENHEDIGIEIEMTVQQIIGKHAI